MRGKHQKLQTLGEKRVLMGNPLVKTPSLMEQTSKIEQKMAYLKQKILQKKKISVNDKKSAIDESLSNFMTRIGLSEYVPLLMENAIDSYDILKEIKQTQLQQIGVLKGHALKIVVQIRKQSQKARKMMVNESIKPIASNSRQETKPTLSQSSIQEKPVACNADYMQTQSFPIQNVKKSFCLYCFTRSELNFCSVNCEQLYNGMFQNYQRNLAKAEQNFIPKQFPKQEQLSDNQQFLENFDFLFNPQLEDLDLQQYERIKQIIKK